MLAIPGIVLLVIFIYARPQEFFERLRVVPFLHLFCALAAFGVLLDVRAGNLRLRSTPQLPWVVLFFLWAATSTLVRAPSEAKSTISELAICVVLYALIAHGVQTFRALNAVAGVVLGMVLLVCGVGVHQAFAPTGCVVVDSASADTLASGNPDGRSCETAKDCYLGDAEPGAEYVCEHVGLLGTTSVGGGRVRFRGVLQDPNELALAGGVGLPLAFAFGTRPDKRSRRRIVAVATFFVVLVCSVLTQSRGGELVFLVVLAAYFLKRFGLLGVAVGGVLAVPLFVAGGRSGSEASTSTLERLDCWAEALSIWRSHPILGVGLRQFDDYNPLTAHNAYLLSLAELGLPGMLLFSIVIYLSTKIPFAVLSETRPDVRALLADGASIARPWAMSLVAAFVGLSVGIFFLSFTYHYVLWIYVGLSGALYSAVRTHAPEFRVKFRVRDLLIVAMIDAAIVLFVFVQTRWMLK